MTTYIKDLIDIPEHVHAGDFVLKLAEGVNRADDTLRQYVVTPQLADCFDQALALVRGALTDGTSKGAYLHGSFGSGKSHFMAVLLLLLRNHAGARSVPELAGVVAKHGEWVAEKRFLLVPYHMIGAESMEAAILGHYAAHVRQLHPDAPVPAVFQSEHLFADARRLRAKMGDDRFFAELNLAVGSTRSGWGTLKGTWDRARFDAAIVAPAGDGERTKLVSALVQTYFASYGEIAQANDAAFVPLEDGLAVMSAHAKALGYDAVILFLDELILWLASRATDAAFVTREGQKLVKLVEYQNTNRPIPIVSFVARQRDLKDLVGEFITGADQLRFADILNYWEARFSTIRLEDRNLPAIASKRLLAPRTLEGKTLIDAAFDQTTRVRQDVMDILLAGDGDRAMFRQVYPFSPALVQALIAVSSALQRERTALKIMLLLLVEQRDRLTLNDIVPVGDLFDVIAEGDEPFTDVMRKRFGDAKKLYFQKLLPLLERDHGVTLDEVRRGTADAQKARAFRTDDRLVKTLLLAALVPEVAAFKAITAARLAALNHGTIKSPIPGGEGGIVLAKCRRWAAEVGEIRVGDEDPNPTISLQLTGIDIESVMARARVEDTAGSRRRKIKELLFQHFGVSNEGELLERHEFTWRGTRRLCELTFGNVREMTYEAMAGSDDCWRVVIDYPFDEAPHTPLDDLSKIENLRAAEEPARTIVWVPDFLSPAAQKDLATLVMLDEVLKETRFDDFVSHLPPVDRQPARMLLENQRSQLRQRVTQYLEAAYGLRTAEAGWLDVRFELSQHLCSLDGAFEPRMPAAGTLRQAFEHLLDQALAHQFPGHPEFGTRLSRTNLKKVLDEVVRAVRASENRLAVEQGLRQDMRHIAVPLRLGEMGETHFVRGEHWKTHFLRKHAQESGQAMTVARLRAWTDEPQALGLLREVQTLVILVFAAQTDRAFFRSGIAFGPSLDSLPDDVELKTEVLPESGEWEVAVRRAAAIFGVTVAPLLSGQNVAKLAGEVREVARERRDGCRQLVAGLQRASEAERLGVDLRGANRSRNAAAGLALVEQVLAAEGRGLVTVLAKAQVPTSEHALGISLKKASDLAAVLEAAEWGILHAACELPDARAEEGRAITARLARSFEADELATALGSALKTAQAEAVTLIRRVPPPSVVAPLQKGGPEAVAVTPPVVGQVRRLVAERTVADVTPAQASSELDKIREAMKQSDECRLTLSWRVERVEERR